MSHPKIKLDWSKQQLLYSQAHTLMVQSNVNREEAWFQASLYVLESMGFEVKPKESGEAQNAPVCTVIGK